MFREDFVHRAMLDAGGDRRPFPLRLSRGRPCKPFVSDMKVHVEAANSFFYPDILVTCDPRDRAPEASHVKRHTLLVVEVLSPGTEARDRGNKFAAYRMLDSLREYVLLSIGQRRIEVFRRDDTGHWVLYPFASGEAGDEAEGAITVEPGSTGELTHTFSAADEVLIGCHEPGHYDAGMRLGIQLTDT